MCARERYKNTYEGNENFKVFIIARRELCMSVNLKIHDGNDAIHYIILSC